MAGSFTVYCETCERPLLIQRRGVNYAVTGAQILSDDDRGPREVACICGAIWRRDSQSAGAVVSLSQN